MLVNADYLPGIACLLSIHLQSSGTIKIYLLLGEGEKKHQIKPQPISVQSSASGVTNLG